MGTFSLQIKQFAEKAQANADEVVRAVGLAVLTKVVQRSPVGNPELWAANRIAAEYNREVDSYNATLRNDPANLTKDGRLKRGKKIKDGMDVRAPEGYVGGRFRGNWQVTIGAPAPNALDRIDPNGGETISAGASTVQQATAGGPSIFIMNNLPYAIPLEYGHSTQAPNGMVRVTVAELQQMIKAAVAGLPK